MRSIRYHPQARDEFLHQVGHYAGISTRLAERYDKPVHNAEAQAAETPELWPPYKHKTRRVIDRRFKFSPVYLHTENEIHVVAVAPTRRKPAYWKARLKEA